LEQEEERVEWALEGIKKLSMVQEDYETLSTEYRNLKVGSAREFFG
jgi:hypothetical protein